MKNKAFTLIELLVVIAIIGLLASIVLVSLTGQRDKARIARGLQFSQSLHHALGAYAVGVWRFDEGSGTTANDSSGFDNHGTLVNNPAWRCANIDSDYTPTGKGCSLEFFSYGSRVQISRSLSIGEKSFTFSHWIKTTQTAGQVYTIGNAGSGNGYRFGIDGGRIQFLIGNSSGHTERVCGSTRVNDGKWHLITGVFDRGNAFKCYVDGKEDGSVPIAFYSGMSDVAPRIGAPPCCVNFIGLIDKVRIYEKSLTLSQIEALYYAGLDNLLVKGLISEKEYQERL